eukprot:7386711-Prymnesium_polylepis.2
MQRPAAAAHRILEGNVRIARANRAGIQREREVLAFHDDAAQRGQRRLDVEQLQLHRLARAEHGSAQQRRQQRVGNLAGSA